MGSLLAPLLVLTTLFPIRLFVDGQQSQQDFLRQIQQPAVFQDFGGQNPAKYTEYEGNLVRYGEAFGDRYITDNQRQNGLNVRLHNFFPFYGGRYNYTLP
ncbi:hypothetical protein ANCCAN_14774 [Ancylostoma caninum]|uniref:Uncharacterized protein n=1 Tax=Ancylostoma caninum TaxID=29170 RepID=A0A368G7K7_ANCCA|nr:hypothetical protein ANCCAN_14774 [Ancylostoma caninum]